MFTALALLLSGCDSKPADAAKTKAAAPEKDAPKADAPKPDDAADKPAAAGACDVTVTAGTAGAAVETEDGKTYCLGDLRLTRETKLEEVRDKLGDCTEQAARGGTHLQCKGVKLSFAGPPSHFSSFEPTGE